MRTRRDAGPLLFEARSLAKELVWFLTNNHRPGSDPDIFLFATRRGGSTWLMELIAANRGVKPLDQPFESMSHTMTGAALASLPRVDEGELVHLSAHQEAMLRSYADALVAGRRAAKAPTALRWSSLRWPTHRLLVKVLAAKALIDWFDRTYHPDVVYLTRHPVAQALSCLRNRWTLTAGTYLGNAAFVEEHLGDGLERYARDVLAAGSPLEQHVLNWTLENLVPLRLLPDRPRWFHVSYESCVVDPDGTLADVATALRLPDVDAMRAVLRRPSRSSALTTEETRRSIEAGDTDALLGGWRRHVDDDEERAAFAILDRFGIDLYRPGRLTPLLRS